MDYTAHIPIPAPQDMNTGLTSARESNLLNAVGNPRDGDYSTDCQPPTSPPFVKMLWKGDIGPFTVEGHHLFLRALRSGFNDLAVSHPDLIPLIGNAGCICCRWVRGAEGVISNHSFGCAIDLKVGGIMPPLGSDWWTVGHSLIYEAMHPYKIFSGAGYKGRKDPMHWEVSNELLQDWIDSGEL